MKMERWRFRKMGINRLELLDMAFYLFPGFIRKRYGLELLLCVQSSS